jgi:hypothetical protein
MKTCRPRPIDFYALDDLLEQWIQLEPPTAEEKALISAAIAASKKKHASAAYRRAKREAWKAGLIPKS